MKIVLMLNGNLGAHGGGPERASWALANALEAAGVLGMVLCYSSSEDSGIPKNKVIEYCPRGIRWHILRLYKAATRKWPRLRARRVIEQLQDQFYAQKLNKQFGDMLFMPKPLFPASIKRAQELGWKSIVETSVLHPRFNLNTVSAERKRLGLNGTTGYTDNKRVDYLEKALNTADHILAWSEYIRDNYINNGIEASKIIVPGDKLSHPGVDLDKYKPSLEQSNNTTFTVLHVSHISIIKGVQYLLDAWSMVQPYINGKLVLVGNIDRDVRKIIDHCPSDTIQCIGRTNKVVDHYQNASIFVSPSISDAGPMTVLEAMACGTPAIVSRRCGFSNLIDEGRNGFSYHWSDIDRLAELLLWCYQNQDSLQSMRTAAINTTKQFGLAVYPDAIQERIKLLAQLSGYPQSDQTVLERKT